MNSAAAFIPIIAVLDLLWLSSLIGLPFLASQMLFGVYIPKSERSISQLAGIRRFFLLLGLSGAALGVALALFAYRLSGGSEGWTLASLLVPQALFVLAAWTLSRRKALALKAERGWKAPDSTRRAAYIGAESRREFSGLPAWAYLLHVAVIVFCIVLVASNWTRIPDPVPMHFDAAGTPDRYAAKSFGSVYMLNILQSLFTFLFLGLHLSLVRMRQNLDPADPEGSLRKRHKFRRANSHMMYFLSLIVIVMLGWGQARSTYRFEGTLPAIYGIGFIAIVIALLAFFLVYLKRRGLEEAGVNRHYGEDGYWRGGAFYYNPQDPAVMVQKRMGMGWTFNFARPLSWVAIAAFMLLPAAAIAAAVMLGG